MPNNLTLGSAAFDTTGQKFGSGALSAGYGANTTGLITAMPFAVGVWFKTATTPNAVQVIVGENLLFWIGYNPDGTIHFEFGGAASTPAVTINSSSSPSTGVWHFATISVSSSTVTGTIDGTVIGTATVGSSVGRYDVAANGGNNAPSGTLGVRTHGGYETVGTYQYSGEVDEVSIWTDNHYPSAFTPPTAAYTGNEANLLALYHLDGNGADSKLSPATNYTLTGPSGGTVGTASTAFTVATGSGTLANPVTITPSDAGGGGSFSPATVSLAAGQGGIATFTYTAASAGTKTISTTNSGSLTNPAALSYAASSTSTTIAPNSPGIVYSPGTWLVGSGSAKTINGGAYFRTMFTGTSCALTLDVSAASTPMPQLWYRIDGAPWVQATIASTVNLTIPALNAAWPKHLLEVLVKSTSEWLNVSGSAGGSRWSPQNTAVVLTGIVLGGTGQTVTAPPSLGQSVWIFGYSITEGYHTINNLGSGAQDTDGSDARVGWAYAQRELLGAEVAVIGFGGAGISGGGVLGVPNLPNSYNLLWSNQTRSFAAPPDLVVLAYGENDGTSSGDNTFINNYRAVLNGLLTVTPSTTRIACLVPFSQRKAADIASAINGLGNARVSLVDTTGMFDTSLSVDGQHPLGVANLVAIAPAVANKLRPFLSGVRNRWAHK